MAMEENSVGRLGIVILDESGNSKVSYRGNELFPFSSTFKVIVAAAILKQSMTNGKLLSDRIFYTDRDLVTYSPITEKKVKGGITINELIIHMLQCSDNTAANSLISRLGGITAVNSFVKEVGDFDFRLERMEPELNTALTNDIRDTASPLSMAKILYDIAF